MPNKDKVSFDKKGFNFFLLAPKIFKKIRPSCIFPPKMNAYRKGFDEALIKLWQIFDGKTLMKLNMYLF